MMIKLTQIIFFPSKIYRLKILDNTIKSVFNNIYLRKKTKDGKHI